jgi:hypothetical protein
MPAVTVAGAGLSAGRPRYHLEPKSRLVHRATARPGPVDLLATSSSQCVTLRSSHPKALSTFTGDRFLPADRPGHVERLAICIGTGNPVWLLRQAPPSGIPGPRQ